MPELPDVVVYCEALAERVSGHVLERVQLLNPFVLRTAVPPIDAANGQRVERVERSGKRIVLVLSKDLYLVIHLMIAGRLRWLAPDARPPARISLAVLHFDSGRLVLTEAGSKRRAALHLVEGDLGVAQFRMGGLEILDADLAQFAARLTLENHTLKRALTDPRLFSGVGNAYSDEILHRARLSPIAHTRKLSSEAIARLHTAAQDVLLEWTARLREQAAGAFPEKVTAFRPEMAVHGRYGKPCPVCGTPVQRIVYAENECNYCARCQTGGALLADRSLSRLLHKSWPRSIDELG
ncbi:MAG TPA: DNA-formamidopyrimidine glycosylase family protein [Casimicrobiaceae bacterium]|nr:DNA-formamidopyrimidine glycosylase family protein [Casimicrobiaceae bacterium]